MGPEKEFYNPLGNKLVLSHPSEFQPSRIPRTSLGLVSGYDDLSLAWNWKVAPEPPFLLQVDACLGRTIPNACVEISGYEVLEEITRENNREIFNYFERPSLRFSYVWAWLFDEPEVLQLALFQNPDSQWLKRYVNNFPDDKTFLKALAERLCFQK